jgi:hypothetical protein
VLLLLLLLPLHSLRRHCLQLQWPHPAAAAAAAAHVRFAALARWLHL